MEELEGVEGIRPHPQPRRRCRRTAEASEVAMRQVKCSHSQLKTYNS